MRSLKTLFCLFSLSAIFGLIVSAAQASPEAAMPVTLQMSLDTNTVSQGEPIVLRYTITNGSGQDMCPDIRDGRNRGLEENYPSWIAFTLKDATGKAAPDVSFLAPVTGSIAGNGPRISGQGSYSGSLVVNQWLAADHPGSYILSVHVRLPCTFGAGGSLSWAALTKDFSLPISITPADSNRLHLKSKGLHTQWLAASDASQRTLALESLLALPEQSALPEWQALVANDALTHQDRQAVAEKLAQTNSLSAVDLLAQLCWSAPEQDQSGTPLMLYLSSMWMQGDAAIKKHIEKLAAEHGEQMPFKPLLRLD